MANKFIVTIILFFYLGLKMRVFFLPSPVRMGLLFLLLPIGFRLDNLVCNVSFLSLIFVSLN